VKGRRSWTGRRPSDRLCLATAFVAKAVFNLPTTRHLLQRLQQDRQLLQLWGWKRVDQVPTEATFSHAFAEFAAAELPTRIHAALVREMQRGRTINYLARDSTAIEAREHLPEDKVPSREQKSTASAPQKEQPKPKPPKKGSSKGQRRKGGAHPRAKASERGKRQPRTQMREARTRLERQLTMTLAEMQAELPKACSLAS